LDGRSQNFESYPAFFQLSKDYEYLKITNMKPNEKVNYILEADEELVNKASLDIHKSKGDKMKKNKRYIFESDD